MTVVSLLLVGYCYVVGDGAFLCWFALAGVACLVSAAAATVASMIAWRGWLEVRLQPSSMTS